MTLGELTEKLFGPDGPSVGSLQGWCWWRWITGTRPSRYATLAAVRQAKHDLIAQEISDELKAFVEQHLDWHGNDLRGYALISWDDDGSCRTTFNYLRGPFSRCLLPAYVSDALNRHIAVDIIKEQQEAAANPPGSA